MLHKNERRQIKIFMLFMEEQRMQMIRIYCKSRMDIVSIEIKQHNPFKKDYQLLQINKMILRQAFERKKKEQFKSRIDITYSKATTICLLIIELTGWGANIGNSRAIFCRQKVGFHFVELSKHQKPYLPKIEKEQYRMSLCIF
ncbi:unnamed protein product [Paramecium primaurelia]|uniref:PPM-type phosphatase domain-containing protein n=1 Tax=Paramecium primaurelia TaxID=5886 RepID=A0A8S1JU98_PARPR|nr:unnamed protein product [Paramecium primaurelia]CAD8043936.1 unnamed protein product [Paramecium primaurelia]